MKIEKYSYDVTEEGKIISYEEKIIIHGTGEIGKVRVHVKPKITISRPEGGCGLPSCHCSDGHWINVHAGRGEDGIVTGLTFKFDSEFEMTEFLSVSGLRKS